MDGAVGKIQNKNVKVSCCVRVLGRFFSGSAACRAQMSEHAAASMFQAAPRPVAASVTWRLQAQR